MESEKIIIGITHGDINGVGYEVILKTLADNRMLETFIPVIYGSSKVAAYHRKNLDIQGFNLNIVNSIEEINSKRVNIINCVFLRHCEQEEIPSNKSVLIQLKEDAETIVNSSGVSALENKYG